MKQVYLIGFRGINALDPRYKNEHPLIWAGHVGLAFKDNPSRIFGFHPSPDAVKAVGGPQKAFKLLRQRHVLDGVLQDDSAIFARAYHLSQSNSRITVWRTTLVLSEDIYIRIQSQVLEWYNQKRTFPYAFPRGDTMPMDRDNCATFPRRLGLPLPEATGQLYWYIARLKEQGERWIPEGGKHD